MRISTEFAGMHDQSLRRFWCDGFMPEPDFAIVDGQPQLAERVWVVDGVEQQCWDFTPLIGYQVRDRESITWHWILPDLDLTGWLHMDFKNKQMKIDPLGSHPDHSDSSQ